jgi:hypothetical protein
MNSVIVISRSAGALLSFSFTLPVSVSGHHRSLDRTTLSHSSLSFSLFLSTASSLSPLSPPPLPLRYSYSVSFFPGLMFEVTAGMCAVSALVVLYVRTRILGARGRDGMYTSIDECGSYCSEVRTVLCCTVLSYLISSSPLHYLPLS